MPSACQMLWSNFLTQLLPCREIGMAEARLSYLRLGAVHLSIFLAQALRFGKAGAWHRYWSNFLTRLLACGMWQDKHDTPNALVQPSDSAAAFFTRSAWQKQDLAAEAWHGPSFWLEHCALARQGPSPDTYRHWSNFLTRQLACGMWQDRHDMPNALGPTFGLSCCLFTRSAWQKHDSAAEAWRGPTFWLEHCALARYKPGTDTGPTF